ncbi:MAG: S8 family serine peptidase, partial [Veillonella sp.]|nr:S8 family serine peptidase [Veillonella sp.]
WLLWLLLGILILLAGALLFRNCSGGFGLTGCGRDKDSIDVDIDVVKPIDIIDGREYNGPIKGIVDENGEMPKFSVVPPIVGEHGEEPPIIDNEGAPNVIANRLNVYLEDDNADLNQWAQDFNAAYSGDNYQIIGCDPNVKLIQIMIPENERDKIREELPSKLPRQRFFVIDESIMSLFGNYKSNSDTSLNGWHLDATRAKQGWEITKGSNDVVVAIVDDGIDASHPIFDNRFYMAYNVFTQDRKLSVGEGHGTHVAGLAAGNGKFLSEGAAGIAQNVKIMPIQVFDNGYCTFSSLASGIMYAIHNGAHVVNISIGPSFEGLDQMPYDQQRQLAQQYFKNEELVFRRIIRKANEKNVILVFAAGNDNIMTAILPECRSAQTINVAAVDHNLRATGFTNYSVGTNISAPGADIYSSVPGGGFRSAQGTSMAAPIVAGAVALMRSIKPDLTVGQAIGVLQKTGIPTDGNNRYVPPMIQIDKALEALRSGDIPSMPVIDMQPIVNPNRGIDEPDVIVIGRDDTKNEVTVIDPDATRIVGGNGHDVVDPNRNNQVITNPNNPNDPNNPTGGNNNTDDYSAMRKLLDQLKAQRDALNQRIDEIEKNINK